MRKSTVDRLRAINRAFYGGTQTEAFSATRRGPWPGFARLLPLLPGTDPVRVLDLGCGNGRLLSFLHDALGARLDYVGVDDSEALLRIARARFGDTPARFAHRDLIEDAARGTRPNERFDLVTLFGVLHHVPSAELRGRVLSYAAAHVATGGSLALTFWRFDRDPRAVRRALDTDALRAHGIEPRDLEPGDVLLPFGAGGAPRYCHLASDAEVEGLLTALALPIRARYRADGRSGELNDYAVLGPIP